jgi:Na+/H+ antiporter NhaD/arsenite permease-like protein
VSVFVPGLAAAGWNTAGVIAVIIFLLVFITITLHLLHETVAALLGAVSIFLVTYIGGRFNPALRILTFEDAMGFVDWNVIFLIMGMMIFMAIMAKTNVFRWLAFRLYKRAKGNIWMIVVMLVTLTGLLSALLNDVTAILLIAPLSIQLALAIDLNPLAIVIAEVLASNIGGAATLIGDPPSTIVGSHIMISFGDYLANMAPVAILCMVALLIINRVQYRKEYSSGKREMAPALVMKLESEAHITDYSTLYKSLAIGALIFGLFFAAAFFDQMPPSVVALGGAAILIAWVRPDINTMLKEVDWTTLIFFIGLFIIVGGMDASGAIVQMAAYVLALAGESLARAALIMVWISGAISGIVANIPYTLAALPIVDLMTATLPDATNNRIIYWALILGADLGGNATYLGSAPNIVAVGLLAQAGYKLSFKRFMRDGVPVTVITLIIASIYLILRYL